MCYLKFNKALARRKKRTIKIYVEKLSFNGIFVKTKISSNMEAVVLKNYLIEIANKVTTDTTIEDIFRQLQLLIDIEESEWQEANGLVYTHNEVKQMAAAWLQ